MKRGSDTLFYLLLITCDILYLCLPFLSFIFIFLFTYPGEITFSINISYFLIDSSYSSSQLDTTRYNVNPPPPALERDVQVWWYSVSRRGGTQ